MKKRGNPPPPLPSPPWKILKVQANLCNLRHSGGKFEEILHTKIYDEYQCCTFNLHSQIHHLDFHRKKYACRFFSTENIFSVIFDSHFCENPRFRDEFQALAIRQKGHVNIVRSL